MNPFASTFSIALALVAAGSTCLRAASFTAPVGLQLYSLRGDFAINVPATLDKVTNFGIRQVELAGTYNLTPGKFREMLDARGLQAVSGHFPFERYKTDAAGIAADAKALGLKYVGCAWVPHEGSFDEQECREAIRVFNAAGEILAKSGIKLFYHCHGYEFAPFGNGTFVDLLMKETNPEFVTFQMDVFWVVHPGHDPVKWLEKYPGRWQLMHVKDMKKGLPTGEFTGKTDVRNDVTVGTGQMNWPAILAAAQKSGVKLYFIEDESPTAAEQIPASLKYLKAVSW